LDGGIGSGTAETSGGGRNFRRRVWERGGSDGAVLDGSGTVVSQGFDWYMNQLETRTGRRRTEEDRARRKGGSSGGAGTILGRGHKKKIKSDSEPVL
jgi:hypothetical protein